MRLEDLNESKEVNLSNTDKNLLKKIAYFADNLHGLSTQDDFNEGKWIPQWNNLKDLVSQFDRKIK